MDKKQLIEDVQRLYKNICDSRSGAFSEHANMCIMNLGAAYENCKQLLEKLENSI